MKTKPKKVKNLKDSDQTPVLKMQGGTVVPIGELEAVGRVGGGTGTLISNYLVLTAAHVVCPSGVHANNCSNRATFKLYDVFPKNDPLETQSQRSKARIRQNLSIQGDVSIYPGYTVGGWLRDDFALITLDQEITDVAEGVKPIPIENRDREPQIGEEFTLVGYGEPDYGTKQKLKLPLLRIEPGPTLQFDGGESAGVRPGDSGGPAISSNGTIVGVCSTFVGSTSNYDPTSIIYDWIIGSAKYFAVWHESNVGEIQLYEKDYQTFRSKYNELWDQGWRLHKLQVYTVNNEARYTAVWRESNVGEIQLYDKDYQTFRSKYDELWDQGWRLHILQVYTVNDEVRYTAVWRESNAGEIQLYDKDYQTFRSKYDELWDQGWRLYILQVYTVNDEVRYTAVWRENNVGEIQLYDKDYQTFRSKYDELWDQGWRLHILQPFKKNGQVKYTAVWRQGSGGELQVYDWIYRDYRAHYDKLWQQGWRIKLLVPIGIDR